MLKFVAFKTQKPRAFNYKPLYYSPEKEAREERRREILSQRGVFVDQTQEGKKTSDSGEYHPGQFIANKRHSRISASSSKARTSNRIKIFTLLVIVLAMGYWIFVM